MKQFYALVHREFREWRTVLIIVVSLFGLGLLGSAYGLHKVAYYLESSDDSYSSRYRGDRNDWNDEDYDDEWVSPSEFIGGRGGFIPDWIISQGRPDLILMGFAVMRITGLNTINIIFMILAFFYLLDSVYKERLDVSTYFYRSLPIHDGVLLGSKLATGTLGILLLSWALGMISVLWARITFPGFFSEVLDAKMLSLSQISYIPLAWDWLMFNILEGLWLLPYAVYLLAISTMVRSRPLLVAIGIPLVLGLLFNYFYGTAEPIRQLLGTNVIALGHVAEANFLTSGDFKYIINEETTLDLFGSFTGAIFSLRTAASLIISTGLFGVTFMAYRRNMATSA